LQSAFEHNQGAGQLEGSIVTLLQVALNMLKRPIDAALHLLGIPAHSVLSSPPYGDS
ncbi:MAG: hypothetical protein QOH93_3354, partial [Chloroflexia bacterium]|nr:hypothetical protein [Chloroflexia bacterium]